MRLELEARDWRQHEIDIRSPRQNAHLMPSDVPIALIHGTRDDNVDIRHAVELYARLLAHGKQVRFAAIAHGNHGLAGAESEDEDSRFNATLKYAADLFSVHRDVAGDGWPFETTTIPVSGGHYEVRFQNDAASLHFLGADA